VRRCVHLRTVPRTISHGACVQQIPLDTYGAHPGWRRAEGVPCARPIRSMLELGWAGLGWLGAGIQMAAAAVVVVVVVVMMVVVVAAVAVELGRCIGSASEEAAGKRLGGKAFFFKARKGRKQRRPPPLGNGKHRS